MNKMFLIARWEFSEKVKSRAFLISLILTPLILIIFTLGGTLFSGSQEASTKIIGFIDPSGTLFHPMKNELEKMFLKGGQSAYLLVNLNHPGRSYEESKIKADRMITRHNIEGYILARNADTDSLSVEYHSAASANISDIKNFAGAFNSVRRETELSKFGVSREVLQKISKETVINHVRLSKQGDLHTDFMSTFFTSVILIMMLMTLVISTGGMLVRSLLEEKATRLIDVIVSSCAPGEMLAGKILGLSFLALFQLAIWLSVAFIISGFSSFPAIPVSQLIILLSYFLLGFFFYTSIFVGVGSFVTTEQGAQQVTGYLSILLVVPVILALPAIENPQMDLLFILSYIPFTTPAIMILRLNISPVPLLDILSTILLMIFSIFLIIRASAKIFRIGILASGIKPGFRELISWLKE